MMMMMMIIIIMIIIYCNNNFNGKYWVRVGSKSSGISGLPDYRETTIYHVSL